VSNPRSPRERILRALFGQMGRIGYIELDVFADSPKGNSHLV
jgi:hypothetical protein